MSDSDDELSLAEELIDDTYSSHMKADAKRLVVAVNQGVNSCKAFNPTYKGFDVQVQDQTSEVINLHLSKLVQEIVIISNTDINDTVITVSSGIAPVVGNDICLKENTSFYQSEILAVAANGANWDITLDTPLDYAFTTLGGCSERTKKLNVDGSVTPQIFSISPDNLVEGTKWHINGITLHMTDATDMDDAKFGGALALARGIVLRATDGITKNFFNAKSNADLKLHMTDFEYSTKAPAGVYGAFAHYDIRGVHGVAAELRADTSDELQMIVQDNLTVLTSLEVVVKGHVVED